MKYKEFEPIDIFDISLHSVLISIPASLVFYPEFSIANIMTTCLIGVTLAKYWQIRFVNGINTLIHSKFSSIEYEGVSKKSYKLPTKYVRSTSRSLVLLDEEDV